MRFLSFQTIPEAADKANPLVSFLKSQLTNVDETADLDEAMDLIKFYDYDAVLVRISNDHAQEARLVRRLRVVGATMPVVVVARALNETARMALLEAGTDDLIISALSHEEVFIRIQNHVRRKNGFATSALTFGNVEVNMNAKKVFVRGTQLSLTRKEYQIIEILALRKGHVLSKETLLDQMYGGMVEPNYKIIDVFVCKVRRKLAALGAGDLIETNWGRGYMVADKNVAVTAPAGVQAVQPASSALMFREQLCISA